MINGRLSGSSTLQALIAGKPALVGKAIVGTAKVIQADQMKGILSGSGALTGTLHCLNRENSLSGEMSGMATMTGALTIPISTEGNPYSGGYVVEPGQEEISLPTKGKVLIKDIIVRPVPSNYGLITWDGSVITIS